MTLFEGIDEGRINPTMFSTCGQLLALGIITKAKLVTDCELTVADQLQLDQLSLHYTSLSTQQKNQFFPKLQALLISLEFDKVDVVFVKAQFGIV